MSHFTMNRIPKLNPLLNAPLPPPPPPIMSPPSYKAEKKPDALTVEGLAHKAAQLKKVEDNPYPKPLEDEENPSKRITSRGPYEKNDRRRLTT